MTTTSSDYPLAQLPAVDSTPDRPVSCDGCGACCEDIGEIPPFTFEGDDAPPSPLAADLFEAHRSRHRYRRNGPCCWYHADTKTCRHYAHRPRACHEFELAGPHCLLARRRQGTGNSRNYSSTTR